MIALMGRAPQGPSVLDTMQQIQQMGVARDQSAALKASRDAAAAQALETTTRIAAANKAQAGATAALQAGGGVRDRTIASALQNSPDAVPILTEFFDKSEKNGLEIRQKQKELNNIRLNDIGHTIEGVLRLGGQTPEQLQQALQLGLAWHAERAKDDPDESKFIAGLAQQLQQLPPDQLRARLEAQLAAAPYMQERQQKASERGPVTVGAGQKVIDPQTGKEIYSAPEKQSFQSKDVMLNGKRANVNFDPSTGKYSDPETGQDVSAKVSPIPPASIIINNQKQNAPNVPTWALDDSRPVGPDGNKPDPTIRMTPNGLYQAAQTWIANGQYPPAGRGNDPIVMAQREAINAKVGAIAAAAGMDVPQLRAFYKSNAASLGAIQKSSDAVQAFMTTADRNSDLLKDAIRQIPDSGIPLLNQPLRAFAKNVAGDPKMSKAATYLQSVSNEYAKIITQPNLSGQLTDAARQEASVLLDPKATVQQMIASIDALRNEGANRMLSLGEQIGRIGSRMQTGPSAPPPPAPAVPAGMIRARDPQGNIHQAPAGTPLPPGWVKVGG